MKCFKYLFLIALCFTLGCKLNNSQADSQIETQVDSPNVEKLSVLTTFTKDKYIEDLDQLINALSENHPLLYEYISKNDLSDLVEKKKSLINDNFKTGEFTWLCRSIVSKIGCGHTVVPTLGMDYFLPDSLLFPLEVNYINSKLYILNPLENKELVSAGDEIITINGRSVKMIIEEISNHISSDADNMSFKTELINDGFMEYAAFNFKFVSKYEIDFKNGDDIKTVNLNQLSTYTEEDSDRDKCENNLCFEIDKKSELAIITIRSFYYYRENFTKFETFIDRCFSEIKSSQIKKLIIDLRDNGGGDPYCASYLLQHIADKPYQYYKTGTFSYADLQQPISPNKNRFLGKPFIFINGKCFSTTGHLCALIKANDFGIFIGKETGATFTCNSTSYPFELKNTGVTPYIATKTFEANVFTLPKDRGIIPHYEPSSDISDLLNDIDVDLEYYKKL